MKKKASREDLERLLEKLQWMGFEARLSGEEGNYTIALIKGVDELTDIQQFKRLPLIEEVSEDIGKGEGMGNALSKSELFPPISIQMIQVGEQSGNLEEMLNKVANVFEKEVETTIMRLTAMLEPIMVVLMAGMVLFIILSIFLPILEMRTLVR